MLNGQFDKETTTRLVVSNIFHFHPYLGKWSDLTNIFQMGWNHQRDRFQGLAFGLYRPNKMIQLNPQDDLLSRKLTFWYAKRWFSGSNR